MDQFSALTQRLKAVLHRRGATPEDAEDLIQDAYAKLHEYEQANDVRHREAFMVRTTMNLAVDAGRRRTRSPLSGRDIDTLVVADAYPGPEEILDARLRFRRMSEGIARMNPKARAILLAHRIEGLTYTEIARREGITVSAVEKQIARSVAFLTQWMREW